jgi:hypothetical protein
MAWAKNGSTTLSGTADTITVSSLTANKTNLFLSHQINNGSGIQTAGRSGYGSVDSGNNYARRQSSNGATDGTATSQSYGFLSGFGTYTNTDIFTMGYFVNISSKEKLFIAFTIDARTSATNSPDRQESVGKWANTSNQIDSFQMYNFGSGDYTTDSNLSVLGSELTPSVIAPETNSIFIETDTAKRWFFDGTYWNRQPDFEYNFPSSTGWSYEGTAGKMSISDNKLFYTSSANGIDARYFYSLGISVTGDFVLDYKMNLTTTTYNTIGQAINVRFGLSNSGTGYSGESPASPHVTSSISGYHTGSYMYNYFLSHNGSSTTNDSDTDVWTLPTSTTQTYYARISRSGSTLELKFFEDANRTTQIGATKTLTSSSTYNYLWAKVFTQTTSNALEGYVEDVKLYNGVSSVRQ